jgi:diguanylate cyclase (GGDEF)-like protein
MIDKNLLKELTILYVEDDDAIVGSISNILKPLIKKLFVANDGEQGLDIYKKNPDIDIIITDINMPKMDGLTMCHNIRNTNISIPIIVTTAHNENDFLTHAIEVGVSGYLMKPMNAFKLIQEIRKAAEPILLKKELHLLNCSLQQRIDEAIAQNNEKDILIQEIFEFQDNMTMVFDEFSNPIFANRSFLQLLNVDSIDDINLKYDNFESIMIENDEYFYPSKIDNDKSWLENLNDLDEKNRVVAFLDTNTFMPEAYLVTMAFNDISKHWICNFSKITQMAVEKSIYKHKAYTDELTQINNRARFNLDFKRELEAVKSVDGYNLCVMIFDIDHFKKFNDTYGHDIGDKILVELSELLSLRIRNRDIFARWGGEEFVILLPLTKIYDALKVANNLCLLIENHKFYKELKVTCSFGVTQVKDTDDEQTSLKRADVALYKAKQNGRNRVEIA